jgi:hypothetical protein
MQSKSAAKRPGVRKAKLPHRKGDHPKTVVPVMGGIQKLIEMNDRALRIMANR